MTVLVVVLSLVLALCAPPAGDPIAVKAEPAIAFVGVNVVPMDREAVLAGQTVVVRGDRIVALGPAAEVVVPEDATRVDGAGRWLMPGLADMHVHTWTPDDFPLFLANGVTTVRNMFGSALQLEWRRQVAAGELLGPTILTAGPIIDGDPPVWPGSEVLTDPAQAEAVVLGQQQDGYDFLKVYAGLKLDVYDALVAAAKAHGMRCMGHVPDAVGIEHVIAARQASIEHLDGFAAAALAADSPFVGKTDSRLMMRAWKHVDDTRLAELAARCAKNGVWNCPTLVVLEKWVGPEAAAVEMQRPEMKYVAPVLIAFWKPENSYLTRLPAEVLEQVAGGDADRKRCVGILHKQGARILAGTDMGNPFVVAGFALHEELGNLVQAGLSPYEALRAATSGAAEFMGASAEWGTVAVGARADLLLLEANPLEDVRHATRRVGVMVRGQWFEQAALQGQLDELAARFGGSEDEAGSPDQPVAEPTESEAK
jgi:imidazolonepropionase-like amidohydrolase